MASLIALDLGSHSVKVTVMRKSGRSWVLEDRYSDAVPQDEVNGPTDESRLAALDALLVEHPEWRAPGNSVVACWPIDRATMRRMEVPFTDQTQVAETLPFTVEGEVPFDMDDMLMGHRVLDVGDGTTLMVALAPNEPVESWLLELSDRGLDPQRVYIDGDIAGQWCREDAPMALIDVGHLRTVISVCIDGVVQWSRAIDLGGRDFTLAVQRSMECSWEQAERIKHGLVQEAESTDPGIGRQGDPLSATARVAVDQEMGVLLAEIRTTLINAEDALEVEIDSVLLTGGGARLYPFEDYLTKDLGVQVTAIADRDGDPVPGEFAMAGAMSQYLAGSSRGKPIDLRVDDLAFKGGVDILRASFTLVSSLGAFLSIAAIVLFAVHYRSLGVEQGELEAKIIDLVVTTELDGVNASVVNTTNAESLMLAGVKAEKEKAAKMGIQPRPPTVDRLLQLTKAFPAPKAVTVDVSNMTITPGLVTFDAETDGYASSAKVEASLKKNECFGETTIQDKGKTRNKVKFAVTIPIPEDCGGDS